MARMMTCEKLLSDVAAACLAGLFPGLLAQMAARSGVGRWKIRKCTASQQRKVDDREMAISQIHHGPDLGEIASCHTACGCYPVRYCAELGGQKAVGRVFPGFALAAAEFALLRPDLTERLIADARDVEEQLAGVSVRSCPVALLAPVSTRIRCARLKGRHASLNDRCRSQACPE